MTKRFSSQRIIILGAGPAGLAAACTLSRMGHANWRVYEKEPAAGGLSASFRDKKGFYWDIGGHVMFSRSRRFNGLANRLMGNEFIRHERESWIRMRDTWVPYPFQNNIHRLGKKLAAECLSGLAEAQRHPARISNFRDWICATFGNGIARLFMLPYNAKVWSVPLTAMSYSWFGDRVSVVDLKKLKRTIEENKDDISWGPNNTFKFPLYGGTGGFWKKFEPFLTGRISCNMEATAIDLDSRTVIFNGAQKENYDIVINTAPLDLLAGMLRSKSRGLAQIQKEAGRLRHNSVYVVGIGLRKKIAGTKCWVYFPEKAIPFYRMTYFSHYSPNNVPGGDTDSYSSLMCEVSFSGRDPAGSEAIVESVIGGLIRAGIILERDRRLIVSRFIKRVEYAYPIPTLGRDAVLGSVQPFLEQNAIYSRGRFGAWRYETGNMDHSALMGIELIERLAKGTKEKVWRL
jgi:protoporphyrinogen oxidase